MQEAQKWNSHQKTATKSFSFRTRSSCLAVTSSISGSLSFSLVALAGDGSGVACFLPSTPLTTNISSARNDPSHSVLDHRIIALCRWYFRRSLFSLEFFGKKHPKTLHVATPLLTTRETVRKWKGASNGYSALFSLQFHIGYLEYCRTHHHLGGDPMLSESRCLKINEQNIL